MVEPSERGSFYELSTNLLSAAFPDASTNWVDAQASTAAERAAMHRLVWRVQDILVGVGLAQADNSIAGGRTLIIPEVISVAKNPVRLNIRTLPGQIPDDFAAHAKRIAYNLDVADVHVVPLGPSLIQFRLVPKTKRSGG